MKKRILIVLLVFALIPVINFINFTITFLLFPPDQYSFPEQLLVAFSHPRLWVDPFYTLVLTISYPVILIIYIVLGIALYYLYKSFKRNKKNNKPTPKKRDVRLPKKIVLWGTFVVAAWMAYVFSMFPMGSPAGGIAMILLFPVFPIIYIFYPIYFVILSVRYFKEKSKMDPLDKAMFYIILAGFFMIYFLPKILF